MINDINESLDTYELSLLEWENLLSAGWDRIGNHFFRRRYDYFMIMEGWTAVSQLMPLRYNLQQDFAFSKSQRIIQRRNTDLKRIYRPAVLNDEKYYLFDQWYLARFNRVNTIFTWVSGTDKPFPVYELCLYKHDKLIGCSFFDVTPQCQYSTVAFYDPNEAKRSLGTYTMMSEIQHGLLHKKQFHYPGHAYYENSMYEYKKRFPNVEYYDWEIRNWEKISKK